MDTTIKIGITATVLAITHSVIWLALIALILLHINATPIMWTVFWMTVPLRIATELIAKRLVQRFNEERE